MLRFKQLLKESFSRPYKWNWDDIDDNNWEATFRTKDGDEMSVNFVNYDDGEWVLTYGISGVDYDRTHQFDALNVFGTVIDITRKFIQSVEPNVVMFSGNTEKGLAKFYKKVMQKFQTEFSKYGYRTTSKDSSKSAAFKLIKV